MQDFTNDGNNFLLLHLTSGVTDFLLRAIKSLTCRENLIVEKYIDGGVGSSQNLAVCWGCLDVDMALCLPVDDEFHEALGGTVGRGKAGPG